MDSFFFTHRSAPDPVALATKSTMRSPNLKRLGASSGCPSSAGMGTPPNAEADDNGQPTPVVDWAGGWDPSIALLVPFPGPPPNPPAAPDDGSTATGGEGPTEAPPAVRRCRGLNTADHRLCKGTGPTSGADASAGSGGSWGPWEERGSTDGSEPEESHKSAQRASCRQAEHARSDDPDKADNKARKE